MGAVVVGDDVVAVGLRDGVVVEGAAVLLEDGDSDDGEYVG